MLVMHGFIVGVVAVDFGAEEFCFVLPPPPEEFVAAFVSVLEKRLLSKVLLSH